MVKNEHTTLTVINGAPHSFRDHEEELAKIVEEFVRESSSL